jgi:hypothetical protein
MPRFFIIIILFIGINAYGQIEGSIYKFKNQWEIGAGSQTYFSKTVTSGIREVYSPFSYLSPLISGNYMRKFRFGKMDYGYRKIHFLLLGVGLKTHWMPTINDKLFYKGLNRLDSTYMDTTILNKNRNGRLSLSLFIDYTKEFRSNGLRYRFGLGVEHHILGFNASNTTINGNSIKKTNTFSIYPPSLFSFSSTSFGWWLRAGIDQRIGSFNYFGGTLLLGYGPENKIVADSEILPTFKFGIQLHYGFLGGYEGVIRRR